MVRCLYDFFRDQGSIIAGLLALLAGWIAFRGAMSAAEQQVTAIREQKDQAHADAAAQIEALERQLKERNREIADMRWREKVEIVRALATESARLDRFARDRLLLAEGTYGNALGAPFGRNIAPYQIEARDLLNQVGVLDFSGTGIMQAATLLNTMVDVLSSALESAGVAGELHAGALIGHLKNVISTAAALKARLEEWEANNPVPQ
jgi:hypothetical protein